MAGRELAALGAAAVLAGTLVASYRAAVRTEEEDRMLAMPVFGELGCRSFCFF